MERKKITNDEVLKKVRQVAEISSGGKEFVLKTVPLFEREDIALVLYEFSSSGELLDKIFIVYSCVRSGIDYLECAVFIEVGKIIPVIMKKKKFFTVIDRAKITKGRIEVELSIFLKSDAAKAVYSGKVSLPLEEIIGYK